MMDEQDQFPIEENEDGSAIVDLPDDEPELQPDGSAIIDLEEGPEFNPDFYDNLADTIDSGVLSGIAFAFVGIDGAVFWGMVMTVFSIVPGIGGAIVWVPTVFVLAVTGHIWSAVGLAAFCALVVGSVDNLLRPRLVGHDTQMHELLIFFSTLGGLLAFGAMGFIVGPILAALCVTTWEMFGTAFRRELSGTAGTQPPPARPVD